MEVSMKKMMMIVPLAVAALAFTVASAPAETTASGSGPPIASSDHGNGPKTFIKKAAEGDITQIDLGRLAERKAASPAVKDFGKRMVTDHSKVNQSLEAVAAKEKVKLPDKLNRESVAVRDRLEKESGKTFDRDYMKVMVSDHEHDVAAFEEAKNSTNPNVKEFATSTLPTLQDHLKEAKKVEASL
jgi:putative membrane protein